MMDFKTNFEDLDDRSIFANRVLALIYQKYGGDVYFAIAAAAPFFQDFENHIKNIYELIEDEIPLYHIYRLVKYGADNWGYSDEEYKKEIEKTSNACHFYYNKERWFI